MVQSLRVKPGQPRLRGRFRTRQRLLQIVFLVGTLASCLVALSLNLTPPHGLEGRFFANATFSGSPVHVGTETRVSTDAVARYVRFFNTFSVEWNGGLVINKSGEYAFQLTSDGESELYIDQQLVIPNRVEPSKPTERTIELLGGVHPVRIRYAHLRGPFWIDFRLARWDRPFESVPARVLLPTVRPYSEYRLRRNLTDASVLLAVLCASAFLIVTRLRVPHSAGHIAGRARYYHNALVLHEWRPVIFLLLLGGIVRLVLQATGGGILWPDSWIFYETAQANVKGDFFAHEIFRTPLYSLLLAFFLWWGETPVAGQVVVAAQHILGLLSTIPFYYLARRVFNPVVAFYSTVLFSLHTLLLYYEATIQSEVLFIFLLSLLLYVFVKLLDRPSLSGALIVGLLCGLLTMARPVGQWFILCLVGMTCVQARPMRTRLASSLAIVVTYLVVISPWLMVNWKMHRFVGVSRGQGLGLFFRVIDIDKLTPVATTRYPEVKEVAEAARGRHPIVYYAVRDRLDYERGYTATQADQAMFGFAVETVLAHPVAFGMNTIKQLYKLLADPWNSVHLCGSEDDPYLCSKRSVGLSLPAFPNVAVERWVRVRRIIYQYFTSAYIRPKAMFVLSVLGIALYVADPRRPRLHGLFLVLTILYFISMPAMFNTQEDRYRLPIDALLLMFAVWGVYRMFNAAVKSTAY